MVSLETPNSVFTRDTIDHLKFLCCRPSDPGEVIPDEQFESIAACLRDLENRDASDRPRTFTVLHMMDRTDLLIAFVAAGLLDNSFPYADRKSLPPLMRGDSEACPLFLELQTHVMSAVCHMEKGLNSIHVLVESGDIFFDTLGRLGKGGEAKVDRVRSKMTRQEYARKRIHRQKDLVGDKKILKKFENELQILKRLDHTHLVTVFASYTDKKYVAFLMKPVAEMDLKRYLLECGGKSLIGPERERFRTYYGCLTSAIAYLHENRIRHKDIKPNNILLKRGDVYITDFGIAIEFDDDKSVTKGTVKSKTNRYQSPEVSRGLPRGKPSDVWSLGVTFLEMTTILRGHSLDNMQTFLAENGTREQYVFGNIQGAIQWMEFLRRTAKQPRVDNSPMQWMKDMLGEKANDRPTASDLFQSIKQAADGKFCNECCHSDGSNESDTSADSENSGFEKDNESDHPSDDRRPKPEVLEVDAVPSTSPSDRSPPHTHGFKRWLYSYLPGVRIPATDETLPHTGTQRSSTPSSVDTNTPPPSVQQHPVIVAPTNLYDPYECSLPGSFPIISTPANLSQHSLSEATDPSRGVDNKVDIAANLQIKTESSLQPLPGLGTKFDEPSVSSAVDNSQGSPKEPVYPSRGSFENSVRMEDFLSKSGHEEDVGKIQRPSDISAAELQKFLSQNSRRLFRTRSDENLQIQQRTNAILSNSEADCEGIPSQSPSRRLSTGNHDIHTAGHIDIHEVRKWKSELDYLVNSAGPLFSSPPVNNPTPESHHSDPIEQKRATSEDSTVNHINQTSQVSEPEILFDPKDFHKPVEEAIPISNPSKPRAAGLSSPPKIALVSRPKTNSLKGRFSQARSPPEAQKTTALTGENIDFLSSGTRSRKQKAHPTFKIQSASVYMKKVYNDAATSVATSVMSTNTRNSMKLSGLMLPLQDRSSNLLERYTKPGNAAAVRMLLQEGCNPGTLKDPRPNPIFHTVRGASSRHTKCLRALIQHNVNTNVRAPKTRKTPLIEAIEQEAWSGYTNVIFLLLAAGANPNAKDGAGDVALLKVLGAGQKPLEKHRRAALALLLSTTYNTNVNITPLGTGNNPLHLAVRRVDPWALSMLLEKDSSLIEAKNSEGLTPLSLACSAWTTTITPGQLGILDVLLEKKANVNVNVTARARTPLLTAVSLGLVEAVERLLVNGADPFKVTRDGKTTGDMANERKKQHGCKACADCIEIHKLLIKYASQSQKKDG